MKNGLLYRGTMRLAVQSKLLMSPRALLPLLLFLLATPTLAAPRLRLLSSVDQKPSTPAWKYVRAGQRVTLVAELSPPVPGATFTWFRLESTAGAVDNTTPSFHFEPIPYEAVELVPCRGQPTCPAEPASSRWGHLEKARGTGTAAFQVRATLPDGTALSSPGIESIERGGLSRAVHRVAFRRDDSYLGFLTELFNLPYIFGSAGPDGHNQTDLLIGSDCADLAIYGARRLGLPARYTNSYLIDRQAPEIARAVKLEGGLAVDRRGRPVAFGSTKGQVQPGDLLHFPNSRHVAVLYEDREPLGVLDPSDIILHTCWAPPTLEPLGQNTACASYPIRILRLPLRSPPRPP